MFDTVHFYRAYRCPICGKEIKSVQVKAFENLLEDYYTGDCPGHAEEVQILKEGLFCRNCSKDTLSVYIVVNRGILTGITDSFEEAQKLLSDLNLEKLILLYHDLYRKYRKEQNEKYEYMRFLRDLRDWYGERFYEKEKSESLSLLRFIWNQRHLKGALNPVESIDRFLNSMCMRNTLDELRREGVRTLDIYYPEEIKQGEEKWSVDVYQDEINERCGLNWTWTVISKKELEAEGENSEDLAEWIIVVDEPFSEEAVCKAVCDWLKNRGYEFEVRMISPEEARGSGLIKELKKIELDKVKTVSLEEAMVSIDNAENKRIARLLEMLIDKRKVFYYDGFYGSLVADPESDRLIGKIEGIKENIIYEGRTVSECEKKFRKAVSRYKKDRIRK